MVRVIADRVGALDRAWMVGLAGRRAPGWLDRMLRVLTHAGGTRATVGLTLLLILLPGTRQVGILAAVANALSHLVVQALKRAVARPRPHLPGGFDPLAHVPDAFSFPSGHACAAMSVGLAYAAAFPAFAWVALALAVLIGVSRVRLGVHYPGDVLAGQLIAGLTAVAVFAWR